MMNYLCCILFTILLLFHQVKPSNNRIPRSQRHLLTRKIAAGISSITSASLCYSSIAKATTCDCCKSCTETQCGCKNPACDCFLDDEPAWYDPNNERIYDVSKKSFLPVNHLNVLEKELKGRRVISIGEVHSNPCHHRVEFEVIKTLAAHRDPKQIQIGLECFYRQHQTALDAYVFQHQDFATLKAQTKWDDTWGYDLNNYAKIFNFACRQVLTSLDSSMKLYYQ